MPRQRIKFYPEFNFDAGPIVDQRVRGKLYLAMTDRTDGKHQPRLFVVVGNKIREIVDVALCKAAGLTLDYSEQFDYFRIWATPDDANGVNRGATVYEISGAELDRRANELLAA